MDRRSANVSCNLVLVGRTTNFPRCLWHQQHHPYKRRSSQTSANAASLRESNSRVTAKGLERRVRSVSEMALGWKSIVYNRYSDLDPDADRLHRWNPGWVYDPGLEQTYSTWRLHHALRLRLLRLQAQLSRLSASR